MYNEDILNSNAKIKECISIKSDLTENKFFSQDKMQRLIDIMREENRLDGYVSTFMALDGYIRITLRKTYFKKFNNSFDPLDFYPVIDNCLMELLNENDSELEAIFEDDKRCIDKIKNNLSLYYSISRPDENSIIINFG